MKYVDVPQIAVIHSETPQGFEEAFNNKMRELADSNPKYEFRGELTAYITYIKHERIIETVADEFEEMGIRYTCGQCPHCEPPKDKRHKWTKCKYSPYGRVRLDEDACELLYKEVMLGKAEV